MRLMKDFMLCKTLLLRDETQQMSFLLEGGEELQVLHDECVMILLKIELNY